MDFVTVFFQLKEYDSLCRENDSLKKEKSELIDRLKKRQSELHEAQMIVQDQKLRLKELDRELIELDRVLSQRLSEASKAEVEEKALQVLINQQKFEEELEEKKTFLVGFEKTVLEISQESNEAIQDLDRKLTHIKTRRELLFSSFPNDWQSLIERVQAKNLSLGNFTKNLDGKCAFCRHKLSLDVQSEIDQQLKLKSCAGCSRIFLPYQVVSGQRA